METFPSLTQLLIRSVSCLSRTVAGRGAAGRAGAAARRRPADRGLHQSVQESVHCRPGAGAGPFGRAGTASVGSGGLRGAGRGDRGRRRRAVRPPRHRPRPSPPPQGMALEVAWRAAAHHSQYRPVVASLAPSDPGQFERHHPALYHQQEHQPYHRLVPLTEPPPPSPALPPLPPCSSLYRPPSPCAARSDPDPSPSSAVPPADSTLTRAPRLTAGDPD